MQAPLVDVCLLPSVAVREWPLPLWKHGRVGDVRRPSPFSVEPPPHPQRRQPQPRPVPHPPVPPVHVELGHDGGDVDDAGQSDETGQRLVVLVSILLPYSPLRLATPPSTCISQHKHNAIMYAICYKQNLFLNLWGLQRRWQHSSRHI